VKFRRATSIKNFGSLLQFLLLAIVVLLLAHEVRKNWAEITDALQMIPDLSLILSSFFLVLGIISGVYAWHVLINNLGTEIPKRGTFPIYLIGQLGKYVPGSLWAILIQMELGRKWRLSRPTTFVASLILFGFTILSGGLIGLTTSGYLLVGRETALWFITAVVLAGIPFLNHRVLSSSANQILKFLKRDRLSHSPSQVRILQVFFLIVAAWVMIGSHLWLLTNSFSDPGFLGFLQLTSMMALAMIAGQITFFLPSGVGVRELILVSGLQTFVSYEQAIAIAIISRLMFTLSDLILGSVAMLYSRDSGS
jgi:uncharacterized membrane protein YbhN (UPF0104 family)